MDDMKIAIAAMLLAEKVAGRCGTKCQAFVDFMRELDFEARQIGYMFEGDGPESHVTAEVRIGGRWRTFDVHWRTYWTEPPELRVSDEKWLAAHPELEDGRDPFLYLKTTTRKWVLYHENAETGERWDA